MQNMNQCKNFSRRLSALLVVLLVSIFWTPCLEAQTQPGKAIVRAVRGKATYSIAGSPAVPLKAGTILGTGTTIKTGPESSVDLFLGSSAGVVRVSESSTVAIDKLTLTDTGADTVVEVQLGLPEGGMLFNVNKLSAASKYEIKLPNGVAGIRGTKGRCNSSGYMVLLDGTLIFVHVPQGGNPTPYTLVAPPPVYFSPLEGVKPAPDDLVKEVLNQFAGPAAPGPQGGPGAGGNPLASEPEVFVAPDTGEVRPYSEPPSSLKSRP
jgi:hypothetical protein